MHAVIALALLAASGEAQVVHKEPQLPPGWEDSASPLARVSFQLSLKQDGLRELKQMAHRVSDPDDTMYGKYLTQQQIDLITAPPSAAAKAVMDWVSDRAGCTVSIAREVVDVQCTLAAAEAMLSTKCREVKHSAYDQRAVRCSDFLIPSGVAYAVHCVYGLHGLPLPPRPTVEQHTFPVQPANVTPKVIETTYKVAGVEGSHSQANRQAVVEFQGQTMSSKDLATFFNAFLPDRKPEDYKVTFVGDPGEADPGEAGGEASLDVQFIMGVAPGVLTEYWYWQSMDFTGDLKKWTQHILSEKNPPLVFSVSYAVQVDLTRYPASAANVADVDADFAKLAARGITILFASGDGGSGYAPPPGTVSQGGGDKPQVKLYPAWPASSPWVTSVGGTRFVDQKAGQPEMATDLFGSGGGFSVTFDAFDAQKDAVAQYFKVAPQLPPSGSFPRGGRGTPDIAGLGEGYSVVINGQMTTQSGTSASTPMFGGLVSLLNEARLAKKMPPMGYLNTWLYKHPDVFTDITLGDNAFGRGPFRTPYGFNCTKGWDPVTGLGTPRFDKMLAAATTSGSAVVV